MNILHAIHNMPICRIVVALRSRSVYLTARIPLWRQWSFLQELPGIRSASETAGVSLCCSPLTHVTGNGRINFLSLSSTTSLIADLYICCLRAGSEVSLAGQVQVRASENFSRYRCCKQVGCSEGTYTPVLCVIELCTYICTSHTYLGKDCSL